MVFYKPLTLLISVSLCPHGKLLIGFLSISPGSHWSPLTLDERSWGSSIRGLLKWNGQPSIKYQGHNVDPNTAVAIATTSDQTYLFTVCLNHTLKIWNISSNRLMATKDLLDRDLQPHEAGLYSLNPSESSFIRVFNAERALDGGHRYYVVTYSPYDDGLFKFWAVKGALTSNLIIEDLFPGATLKPLDPDPSGNVFWNVADFQIKSVEEGKGMELWVLWRNKNVYQLYSLHFDFQSLVSDWSSNWVSTALETRRDEQPPSMVASDVVEPTDKWLRFLLHPGRFPPEVLETALAIYQEATRPLYSLNISKKNVALEERLCSIITSSIPLRKYAEEEMDFARYRTDTDSKWRAFWQIADDVNKRRFEPVSLTYDSYCDLPWLLLSDSCAVVRECSSTELLLHNTQSEIHEDMSVIVDRWRHRNLGPEANNLHLFEQASFLVDVASDFRLSFPAELVSASQAAVETEIFTEPLFSVRDRIASFQDRCNFADLISDENCDALFAALEERMNVYKLPSEVFYTVIDTVPLGFPGKDSDLLSTHFGIKATVNGAEEMILHTRQILFDLLLLAVFLDGEVDQEGGSNFDVESLFSTLIEMLREYEVMLWLCSNVRRRPDRFHNNNTTPDTAVSAFSLGHSGSKTSRKDERLITILEDLFATPIKPHQTINMPQSYALTLSIRDVLSWVTRQGEVALPNVLVFIQCDLLAKGNTDLAWDFLRFQISTSWATYVKGRLYVAISEYDTAAIYFRKAAYLLSCGKPLGNLHEMSSTLLDIVSANCFYNGLPKYFQHVLSIFEDERSFSHVAEFASLALQALESEHRSEEDVEYTSLRSDLLSRLFHASLTTCRFDQAYSAVSRYQNRVLQKAALGSLVKSILTTSGPGTSGLDHLLHLPTSVAPNIASCVDETLLELCTKQTTFTSFAEDELVENTTSSWAPDSHSSPDYSRILQAYRIGRNDYRGAAEIAYGSIQRLKKGRDEPSSYHLMKKRKGNNYDGSNQQRLQDVVQQQTVEEDDPESKEIRRELLALINLLACVDKSEAYILVERDDNPPPPAAATDESGLLDFSKQGRRRRVIVTLDHLRREYQSELDRVSRIERGDWEFGFGGTEDEEEGGNDGGIQDGLDETMVIS